MSQLSHIMLKLYEIDQDLGGNAKKVKSKQDIDQFMVEKDNMLKLLTEMRQQAQIKDSTNRSGDTIRAEIEFKNKIKEAKELLAKMNNILRKQAEKKKKHEEEYIQKKGKLYENLKQQIEDFQNLDSNNTTLNSDRIETITEQKARLMKDNNGLNEPLNITKGPSEASEQELQAMERWKQREEAQNQKLDSIIDGIKEISQQAIQISEKTDEMGNKIVEVDQKITTVNQTLITTNAKLKKIITHYRKPGQFCLDVILILLLIGLGVTLYYYLQ